MRVLVAMSGGVDSSVAAALLREQGHDVVGVTMKLWGGASDSGCCSVADVDDARRVAQQLGIDHWVFAFTDDFEAHVVEPYVAAHAAGRTPNPCIECNRRLKFDRLLRRADQLGFDAVATGHHAQIVESAEGRRRLRRGVDRAKDQSYVLYVLGRVELTRCLFPIGRLTKAEVRARAAALGLRTADKPDSQDVCFVLATGGRRAFLEPRIGLHPARLVDTAGHDVGRVDAVELVTVGQRRGLGAGGGPRRYALAVDVADATVTVGSLDDLAVERVRLSELSWVDASVTGTVLVQCSAHGPAVPATFDGEHVTFAARQRAVAPGQSVVLYDDDDVLGGGIVV
jgi:tRNA-uridine 2-sulfurtransferase